MPLNVLLVGAVAVAIPAFGGAALGKFMSAWDKPAGSLNIRRSWMADNQAGGRRKSSFDGSYQLIVFGGGKR
jgi:hypothetical protein